MIEKIAKITTYIIVTAIYMLIINVCIKRVAGNVVALLMCLLGGSFLMFAVEGIELEE